MRIDAFCFGRPQDAAKAAKAARRANLNGLWFPETGHDPFLSVLLASQAEPELEVGTGIAVGFARSPMTLAQTAWDLANLTQGKFLLGLGSQVKAHITRRFSMPWGKPVEQMRELIAAVRAIWSAFSGKSQLNFKGDYYQLNLLTPFFTPAAHAYADIPVGIAAVGPKMLELAGECADFLVYHSFNNLPYIQQVAQPALQVGLARAGRCGQQLQRMGSLFVITGNAEMQKKMEASVRNSLAFYASTPAYLPVLQAVGFADLHEKLYPMSRQGQWADMAAMIPDELLQLHSLRAPAAELPAAIAERYADYYDRVCIQIDPADLIAMGL